MSAKPEASRGATVRASRGATVRVCASGGPRWYLVQTAVRAERRTAQRLGWEGYATTLPLVSEPRRDRVRRRVVHTVRVPAFPGYVFVALDLQREALHPVLHCEGVKRMFTDGAGQPVPIRRGVVERLAAETGELLARRNPQDLRGPTEERRSSRKPLGGFGELAALAEGSRLRVTAGPFEDHEGICLWSTADRVALLMEVMGGAWEFVVPRSSVSAV